MNYNYHNEISELLDDGMSYEEACAWCEFVFGESKDNEEEVPSCQFASKNHLSKMAMRFKNTPNQGR